MRAPVSQDLPEKSASRLRRFAIVGAAIIAAAAFALSVHGGSWWTLRGEGASVEIGPFGSERCFGESCAPAGLGWIGASERWLRIGTATWAAGLLAMLALLALAGAVAANRRPPLLARFTLAALLAATLAGISYVALFPGMAGTALGSGVPLYAAGVIVGVAATLPVLRRR